ncbi:MAG: DUF2796 domain-containing protein [Proteobacteria bacterium]|nr:DUF2796 domain-containing protein [Pseudomonadota bacterium]
MRYGLLSGLSVAISIATSMAAAQSAHVHGEGRVNIAIDGNNIFMALESPGADIVGFEHEARTSDEKAAVNQALAKLGDPMLLMRFTADASCEVRRASSEIEGEHDEHEGEEHSEHDEHEDEEHAEHEGEEEHGAFVAEYEFECAHIGALDFIEFTYFSQFSNSQSLDIVLIDGSGQRREEIDRANPMLQLKK